MTVSGSSLAATLATPAAGVAFATTLGIGVGGVLAERGGGSFAARGVGGGVGDEPCRQVAAHGGVLGGLERRVEVAQSAPQVASHHLFGEDVGRGGKI